MKLVLLPGMDGTGSLYAPFREALIAAGIELSVVRYPVDQPLGYHDLQRRVGELLPTEEPYLLLAESFSGPIGIALAASQPPQLRGLLLCCTFAASPLPLGAKLARCLRFLTVAAIPDALLASALFGHYATPTLQLQLRQAVAQITAPVLRRRMQEVLQVDVRAQLAQITVPCWYLQARHDRVVGRHAARLIQGCLPHTHIVSVAAPHCLLQACPDAAVDVVRAFMSQVPAT